MKDIFAMHLGRVGMVCGWFKYVTFMVHFISIIIASAPPQSLRHSILEAEDPC